MIKSVWKSAPDGPGDWWLKLPGMLPRLVRVQYVRAALRWRATGTAGWITLSALPAAVLWAPATPPEAEDEPAVEGEAKMVPYRITGGRDAPWAGYEFEAAEDASDEEVCNAAWEVVAEHVSFGWERVEAVQERRRIG